MKRTDLINFLILVLCVGFIASLLLNVYQFWSFDNTLFRVDQVIETGDEAAKLREELASCAQESHRKDSVITVLKRDVSANVYANLSTHRGP